VGVPVLVKRPCLGAVVAAADDERPQLPADALDRLAVFTELMATAIANSDARTEIERLAGEQEAASAGGHAGSHERGDGGGLRRCCPRDF